MKVYRSIAAALFAGSLLFTLSACDNQGPLEEAGEEMDEKFDDAGDALDDATDGN